MKQLTEKEKYSTKVIAFCAIASAFSCIIMMLGGLIPVFTYCSPLIASLLLVAVYDSCGPAPAWLSWAAAALLSFIISLDKEAAFFYLFFSWYPIVKPKLDLIKPKSLCFVVKIIIFSVSSAAMYFLTCKILGIEEIVESYSASLWINIGFSAVIVLCMMLFDKALIGFTVLYITRIKNKIIK